MVWQICNNTTIRNNITQLCHANSNSELEQGMGSQRSSHTLKHECHSTCTVRAGAPTSSVQLNHYHSAMGMCRYVVPSPLRCMSPWPAASTTGRPCKLSSLTRRTATTSPDGFAWKLPVSPGLRDKGMQRAATQRSRSCTAARLTFSGRQLASSYFCITCGANQQQTATNSEQQTMNCLTI